MLRVSTRSTLWALMSGFLVSACGGVPEEGKAPEEALGTQESELCSEAYVAGLSVDGVSTYQGLMAGAGSYSVGGGANAVRLEYYTDGALKYYEERMGTPGSWNFSYSGYACGQHSFQVKAVPMIVDSAGTRTTCASTYAWSATYYPTEACATPPSATLSCTRSGSTINCTAGASGGSGSYSPMWQEVYDTYPYGWYSGGYSQSYYCGTSTSCSGAYKTQSTGTSAQMIPIDGGCTSYERLQIQFKVRDSSGLESTVRSSTTYTCYY